MASMTVHCASRVTRVMGIAKKVGVVIQHEPYAVSGRFCSCQFSVDSPVLEIMPGHLGTTLPLECLGPRLRKFPLRSVEFKRYMPITVKKENPVMRLSTIKDKGGSAEPIIPIRIKISVVVGCNAGK